MKSQKQTILMVLGCLLYCALAATGDPIPIKRVTGVIVFDGKIDEPFWQEITPLPLTMQLPTFEGDLTEHTEIRIAYDDDYIYLSGFMLDSDADKIMANSKKRDALTGSTEWFGCVIDTYNDKENALGFFTTPTGLRLDASVFNDAEGNFPINLSWNNFWDVAVTQNEEGWYAEMRIPFSSLAFQPNDGKVVMGITVWRYIARKIELQIFPAIPPTFGDWSSWKPSQMQEIVLEDIEAKKPFYITPYVIGGVSDINELNAAETSYINDTDPKFEVGLDLKYGLSNNWTLDITANTDFAQVEADDQQVNLTRFSLFFPEKRLFFQERSGVFGYNFGRQDNLFYSRRIGIDDDGAPIRIYGGARVVGRSGDVDVGFLNMQTARADSLNSENFTVLRVKKQIINNQSDAGFIVTNRMDFKGNYNTTYGLDASIKVFKTKDDFVQIRVAQTLTNGNVNKVFSLDPSRVWISMGRRSQEGFSYGASLSRAGRDFDPGMGFEARDNYTRVGSRLQYTWFPGETSKIFKHGFSAGGVEHWSNELNALESVGWRLRYELQTKDTWFFALSARPAIERLDEAFELSDDVIIPIGDYEYWSGELDIGTPYTKPLWTIASIGWGQFFDGNQFSVTFNPTFNVSPSLELTGTYQYNHIDFDMRGDIFDVHLGRLSVLAMFSTRLSVSALLQYNSLDKEYSGNIRLRYNPREGNDLYIVFNTNVNADRRRELPFLPASNERTFLIKYSYTIRG